MKILFTGGSSFTGCWFIQQLSEAGHTVTATFTRDGASAYLDEPRRQRVAMASDAAFPIWHCRFGDDRFLDLCKTESFDVLCHHAADVTNYKSDDFDIASALATNTHRCREVLIALQSKGCNRVVLTGSVFEGGEGAGSEGLPHFSPYGVSKSLTANVFEFWAQKLGLSLGKFVIPNPFGPYEDPRFTAFLVRSWYQGQTPAVKTPSYIRDNIHVELLAKAYVKFASELSDQAGYSKHSPSGYVETQGAFALRFAEAMRPRLNMPCNLELAWQKEFPEPRVRLGTNPQDPWNYQLREEAMWDDIANYYRGQFGTR